MNAIDFGFGPLEADLWRLLFAMTRIGAALLAVPLFGSASVPMQLRVILVGAIAATVITWTPFAAPPALFTLAGVLACLKEVLVGLALGFVLQFSFAAPVIAAEVIGGGMGMNLAASVDPATGARSPVLGQFFGVLMTLTFLGLGAHLVWIGLLMDSYRAFPPGGAWLGPGTIETLLSFAGEMFAAAVAIALPVTLVLLVVQVVTGIVSRSAPSLNLFALGLPASVLAGLAALIAAVPLIGDRMAELSSTAVMQAGTLLR
ncbi:flagellar biosynthetic protein FliR [Novosphingobium sp. ZN18A2]|uniref:flagellar biosynthetic protein FliR n=1 Tax=Novosphingobium sp. ZN18A2 TaxID=3079861 RepID=UPI0030CD77FC